MTTNTYMPEQITALYARLSQEDALDGDSNSIINQEMICQGVFLRIATLPCLVSFGTLAERKKSRQKDSLPPYWRGVFSPSESARLPQGSTTAALMGGGE